MKQRTRSSELSWRQIGWSRRRSMRSPIRAASGPISPCRVSEILWATTSYTLREGSHRHLCGSRLPSLPREDCVGRFLLADFVAIQRRKGVPEPDPHNHFNYSGPSTGCAEVDLEPENFAFQLKL